MRQIIFKVTKATSFPEIDGFLFFNQQDYQATFSKIELKNTFTTDVSTIKTSFHELFFEHFSYFSQEFFTESFLPPRIFFNSPNVPMFLLTQNSEQEIQEYCPHVNFIKDLTFFGTLRQNKDKGVYLELDDALLINIMSNTLSDTMEKKDDFNITVISKDEYEKKEVFPISEYDLNRKYEFKIKNLYSIHSQEEEFTNKIWFLEIESQDLEDFRYKYHLCPKTNGHNFSIVLGFAKYFKLRKTFPKMKINISFHAA